MRRASDIRAFVESLATAVPPNDLSVNPYTDEVRRNNLIRWITAFDDTSQSVIFIGEAPGRDGARITGIPFVSPQVLTSGADPWGEFGPHSRYRVPLGDKSAQRERSATRLWKHLPPHFKGLPRSLTWNIYPFWPFSVDNNGKQVNRAPTREEIVHGSRWLLALIGLHPNAKVVAFGNKAKETLVSLGIDAPKIPHPSRGSDAKLIAGLISVAEMLRK